MKTNYITECMCGSKDFIIIESIVYKANIAEDSKVLEAESFRENSIDDVRCFACDKTYNTTDFEDIQFNG